jgi:shikimate kinase
MGSGKSSVGRLVANLLRFRFVDTDELIETRAGMTVPEIFAKHGEQDFRDRENQITRELENERNLVIATGGGLVLNPDNMASLKTHCLVVCLWAPPETIWDRVKSQTHRPLLQTPDPPARIRELITARAPSYRQADVLLHSGFRPPREVAAQVLFHFNTAKRTESRTA